MTLVPREDSNNTMLRAAVWYAELGYPVFPCAPGRKYPLTDHGLLDATTDQEQIERYWSESPSANVAIRTDGLLVIDIDGADNPWLADEPAKQTELDAAPLSLTPRGGRHYFFRQPNGHTLRNTAGQLAPHVDTRANGGYVLVAPSIVGGKKYRWAEEHELTAPPDKLPEPPAWLVMMLGTATRRDNQQSNMIPEGQRDDTLARLAGAMRRVGMSGAEIAAALLKVNSDRCIPPLDPRRVDRIATSIARYAPDAVSVALAENHWAQDRDPQNQSRPMSVRELMSAHTMLRAPVIRGLLRRGETMNVIAPPKTGKSWLVLALAMAVATGRKWLDTFETIAGNVLILDNELHPETLAHRIPQVAECLRVGMDEIAETISVQSLRGQLCDIFSLRRYLDCDETKKYRVVILDAFYRFMPPDTNENDNGTMAGIYNLIDAMAAQMDCCFILIHHATKGNQSLKSITDVGAGAGSQSRAADTHLVLRPHEEPGAVVLEAAVRSWPPVEPTAMRWLFPLWKVAPDLDPAKLRSEKPKRSKSPLDETIEAPAWSVERFVETFISQQPITLPELRELVAKDSSLPWRRASDLLALAEQRGIIQRMRLSSRGGPLGFALTNGDFGQSL